MKNDYFEQKLKALTANKEFKLAVAKFRKEWKLPAKGLAINENAIKDWVFNITLKGEKPDGIEAFFWIETEKKIAEYVSSLNKGLFEGEQEEVFELESSIFPSRKEFNQGIRDILSMFSLPYSYFEYLKRYLIVNDFHYLSSNKIKVAFVKRPGEKVGLGFEIFQDTTGEDIISELGYIKEAQEKFFGSISGRERGKKNFERDLMIYELREQELTAEQIRPKLKEKFGSAPYYEEIYQIYKRFKKTYFGKKTK